MKQINTVKSVLMKKLSASLVSLLLISMMMPVLAYAGVWFSSKSYVDNTVTVEVYVDEDVYKNVYGGKFFLDLINADGVYVTTVDATYDRTVGGKSYYCYSGTVTASTYYILNVYQYFVDNEGNVDTSVYGFSATDRVNRTTTPAGGNNGGGIYIPSTDTVIGASQIANAFAGGKTEATFTINGESATLPASALADAPAGAVITIENATGSYSLPIDAIDLEALAEELGVALANLNIKVSISALTGADASKFEADAKAVNGTPGSSAVNFTVTAEGNGESLEITDFGSTYAKRTIKNVNASSGATGVLYNPATGELSFIPATFSNGVATLKSTTNSIYGVVKFNNSFPDVNGHWGEEYAVSMANKLIAEGYEDGTFGPDRSITRAEFATLVVRALGLSSKTAAAANFSDVKAGDWYAKAVAVAAEAGIVNGYTDGTFQPNKVITREELAAMVVRASAFAGTDLSVDASGVAAALAAFSDADGIVWADAEVAAAVEAGIVEGFEDGTFRATDTATRAQAAAMLQRFLIGAELISE